jgi:hypothetical protein
MSDNLTENARRLVSAEYSNADLIGAVVARLRHTGPTETDGLP